VAARKSWSQLTPAYRARLERKGITAATHASASKVQARGYHPRKGAVNRRLYNRIVNNEGTVAERRTLAEQFIWPDWVPRTLTRQRGSRGRRYQFKTSPDVAAGLSLLPNPKYWRDVEFVPRPNGEPWTMIVHLKNGNRREILIPGGGGPGSGAKETLEIVTQLREERVNIPKRERRRYQYEDVDFFAVVGSDEGVA
jgi:hypothetical protein